MTAPGWSAAAFGALATVSLGSAMPSAVHTSTHRRNGAPQNLDPLGEAQPVSLAALSPEVALPSCSLLTRSGTSTPDQSRTSADVIPVWSRAHPQTSLVEAFDALAFSSPVHCSSPAPSLSPALLLILTLLLRAWATQRPWRNDSCAPLAVLSSHAAAPPHQPSP